MGNTQQTDIQTSINNYVPTGPHVEHQQRFFQEYQKNCMENPQSMMEELKKWEDADKTILGMTIEDQASYADYVTRKTCELDEEIVVSAGEDMIKSLNMINNIGPGGTKVVGACAVGNTARIILELKKYPDQVDVYNRALEAHNKYLMMAGFYNIGKIILDARRQSQPTV